MNQLSWLLYFANVVGNLAFPLGFLALVSSLSFAALIFGHIWWTQSEVESSLRTIERSIDYRRTDDVEAFKAELAKLKVPNPFFGWLIFTGVLFAVSLPLSIAVPSKETVYAIAASEMGEKALATPTATKAFKALDVWLDKQIAVNSQPEQTAQ